MSLIHHSRTAELLTHFLPTELVWLIFELWLGKHYRSLPPIDLGYIICKYNFYEGVKIWLKHFHQQPLVLDQMLFGAASANNIPMSLRLRQNGSNDIQTAINIALEHGHLEYVRTFMYLERIPYVPLSIYRWLNQN